MFFHVFDLSGYPTSWGTIQIIFLIFVKEPTEATHSTTVLKNLDENIVHMEFALGI